MPRRNHRITKSLAPACNSSIQTLTPRVHLHHPSSITEAYWRVCSVQVTARNQTKSYLRKIPKVQPQRAMLVMHSWCLSCCSTWFGTKRTVFPILYNHPRSGRLRPRSVIKHVLLLLSVGLSSWARSLVHALRAGSSPIIVSGETFGVYESWFSSGALQMNVNILAWHCHTCVRTHEYIHTIN